MTDLTPDIQAARSQITQTIPLLREAFAACWDTLYADKHRQREHINDDQDDRDPRAPRCGSCEHADDHDPGCQREACSCHTWESWPSTVGWAQWTGPGQAEVAYTRATQELQRAHDCMGEIEDVPAHWASDALCKPGNRTVPMALDLVLRGVSLLEGALSYVTDDLAPPEASALATAADHVGAALKAFDRAEDRISPDEWAELNQPRCVIPNCRIAVEADGLCKGHHDGTVMELATMERCVHCREKPPERHRQWCARCRRGHASDRMSCSVQGCRLNQREAS